MTDNDHLKKRNNGNNANISKWIGAGWDLVFSAPVDFILIALIYIIVLAVASSTAVAQFLVWGPMNVGFYYVICEKIRGRPIRVGDISKGFNFFLAAILSNILIAVFFSIGFAFCIIPGLLVAAIYIFAPIFIVEKDMDFWEAMEASRKVVSQYLFEMSVFVLVQFIILLAGTLLCGLGLLIAVPVIMASTAYAYDDLVGISRE
jgi:uncharacterized membrane protein